MSRTPRVLIAKPGLDGHDRGARIIAMGLRESGFEVVYTGRRTSPTQVVNAAVQEDVDAIGLSILSGAHMSLFQKVIDLMKEKGIGEVPLFGGGIIPPDDATRLKEMGVREIFGPGTSVVDIVEIINRHIGIV